MTDDLDLSARLGAITNLTHGFIYFAPEVTTACNELGLPATHHYFASRGAAFGPVPAGVIIATFFNFNPAVVHAAIPDAWTIASPDAIQTARMEAAATVLRRDVGDAMAPGAIDEATELVGRMIGGVGDEGRALAAANRAVPEPDDPWARLWQRITVVREWRGDTHVAALTAAGLDPVGALALHAATGVVPRAGLIGTRQWSEADWGAGVERLRSRGLLDADEAFTDAGRAFRAEIERETNAASMPLVDAIGVDDTRRLIDLLKPIRAGLLEAGAFARLGG